MDTVVKIVSIIRSSSLNHRKSVGQLEETESEHSEIIYHTNVSWLSRRSVLKRVYLKTERYKIIYDKE
jgi:hypothetical protein